MRDGKSRKKIRARTTIILSAVAMVICWFVVSQLTTDMLNTEYRMFLDLQDFAKLSEYELKDEKPEPLITDGVVDSYHAKVAYQGGVYTVCAYVFDSEHCGKMLFEEITGQTVSDRWGPAHIRIRTGIGKDYCVAWFEKSFYYISSYSATGFREFLNWLTGDFSINLRDYMYYS